jgi:RNA polymerase sigma-70 factor (ECF subfamily)
MEDAEDLLLEVFVAAVENDGLLALSNDEQLAWLRRVAHNKFIDYYRRSQRRPAVSLEEVTEESLVDDDDLSPEHAAVRQEEHTLLRARLSALPEMQQTILRLRFADGWRCKEIAGHINKSEGAVRTMLSRSLNLLRNIYASNREGTSL